MGIDNIATQCNSTCFQIICNKNRDEFNRRQWFGGVNLGERDLQTNGQVYGGAPVMEKVQH